MFYVDVAATMISIYMVWSIITENHFYAASASLPPQNTTPVPSFVKFSVERDNAYLERRINFLIGEILASQTNEASQPKRT